MAAWPASQCDIYTPKRSAQEGGYGSFQANQWPHLEPARHDSAIYTLRVKAGTAQPGTKWEEERNHTKVQMPVGVLHWEEVTKVKVLAVAVTKR